MTDRRGHNDHRVAIAGGTGAWHSDQGGDGGRWCSPLAQGAKRIILVPLFMAQGGHLKQDLPLLVGKIREQHPQLELQVMPAIGDAPEILQAISDWVLRSASI